jgi:hypothetical protein
MCVFGSQGDGGAGQARADEAARQARIKQGTDSINSNFNQFNDDFFNGRRTAYTNFAMPQVGDQYGQSARNLSFSLARNGLSNSSEAARQSGILERDNAAAQQQVASGAIGEDQKARQAVEQNRSDLLAQLNATSDPTMAANASMRQAAQIGMQPGYSPLGNLFQNTTAVIGSANQGGYYGGPGLNAFTNKFGFGNPVNYGSSSSKVYKS